MIQNEVSILRRVKHPNIVLLIEEMDVPTELYLVMELVKVWSSFSFPFLFFFPQRKTTVVIFEARDD
jgi:hypothetical protein